MASLYVAQFTVLDDRYVEPKYDWQDAFEFPRHFESKFEVNPWTEVIGVYTDRNQALDDLFDAAHDLLRMFYKNVYGSGGSAEWAKFNTRKEETNGSR